MGRYSNATGRGPIGNERVHSPLLRTVDRVERAVHRITVAIVIAVVPLALWLGVATYGEQQQLAAHVAATTRTVQATTLADAPRLTTMTSEYSTPPSMTVPAEWTVDGRKHDGQVAVAAGTESGSKTDLTVDAAGIPAAPAASGVDITIVSIFAAVVTLVTAASLLAVIGWATRRELDRRRDAMWDDALYRFFS